MGLTGEELEYLALLAEDRAIDIDQQAREQAEKGYSMQSVRSLMGCAEECRKLAKKLRGLKE